MIPFLVLSRIGRTVLRSRDPNVKRSTFAGIMTLLFWGVGLLVFVGGLALSWQGYHDPDPEMAGWQFMNVYPAIMGTLLGAYAAVRGIAIFMSDI